MCESWGDLFIIVLMLVLTWQNFLVMQPNFNGFFNTYG